MDRVPGNMHQISYMCGTKWYAYQVGAICFIVIRWVWDLDVPGVLVADGMNLGKTFTSVAAAIICTLLTEKVLGELLLTRLQGNTLEEWVKLAQNDYPGRISKEQEWNLLKWLNSVPHYQSKIQLTLLVWPAAPASPHEPSLVVTIGRIVETFKSFLEKMTYGTDFNPLIVSYMENTYLINENMNICIAKPGIWRNIQHHSYNSLIIEVKSSSNGQIAHWLWSYGIFIESDW